MTAESSASRRAQPCAPIARVLVAVAALGLLGAPPASPSETRERGTVPEPASDVSTRGDTASRPSFPAWADSLAAAVEEYLSEARPQSRSDDSTGAFREGPADRPEPSHTATQASSTSEMLIVLNKSDHEAALVDPRTLSVLEKLPTGQGPHEVAVSPDGRRAYVANYGSYAVFREGETARMQPGNTITVIDLVNREVSSTFSLGEYTQPHGLRVSRDGSRLWTTCEGAGSVVELDASDGRILKSWKTHQRVSHMLAVSADEKKLYVANIGSGSVTVIEREFDSVRNVTTGAGAEGIDISPDGKEVWVTNRGANTISIINTRRDAVVAERRSGGQMPIRAQFTPDGRQVWVSNARSGTVAVFDARRRRPLGTIEVGSVPVGIQISPDGKRAFVANTNDDKITVIDVAQRKVVGTFTTGREPDGMAWVQ